MRVEKNVNAEKIYKINYFFVAVTSEAFEKWLNFDFL